MTETNEKKSMHTNESLMTLLVSMSLGGSC